MIDLYIYYCIACGDLDDIRDEEERCQACGSTNLLIEEATEYETANNI